MNTIKSGYFGRSAKIKCKPRLASKKKTRRNSAMFMSKNKDFAVRVANSCLLANDANSLLLRPQGNGYDTAF
jgi:hypothetical protein